METAYSRKEKFSPSNKSSLKKKVATIVVAGSILVGAGAAFGASPLLGNVQSFISSLLGTEKGAVTAHAGTTQDNTVNELETFLDNLKTTITEAFSDQREIEKTRVTNEVTTYNNELQDGITVQTEAEIEAGKTALTETANTEIQEAKQALDSKFNEIFPTPVAE
jgi:hypothetical protein